MSDVFEFVLAGHHVSSKIKQIASAICAEAHIEGTSTERSEETYETTRLSVFVSSSRSPAAKLREQRIQMVRINILNTTYSVVSS